MASTTDHDPTRDERFEIAAQGVPGALPIGDLEPGLGDQLATGGLTPDGRKAEGGISGSSVRLGDKVFKGLAAGSGAILLVVMAAIAIFLIWKAIPAFTDNSGNIFTTQAWNPQATPPYFGMAAVFFGTVMSSFIALVIGVPIAIGIAVVHFELRVPAGGDHPRRHGRSAGRRSVAGVRYVGTVFPDPEHPRLSAVAVGVFRVDSDL